MRKDKHQDSVFSQLNNKNTRRIVADGRASTTSPDQDQKQKTSLNEKKAHSEYRLYNY